MAAAPSIDLSGWLSEQLAQATPDLLRQMMTTFVAGADGRRGGRGVRRRVRRAQRGADEHPQRVSAAGVGHPGRHDRVGDPETATGSYFPDWLLERRRRAEAALVTVVATSLPARGVDPADGEAGRDARHQQAVEVAGQRDGQGPRRAGGGVPDPAVGRRPVHVRGRRRAGAQGPRGRPHGQRARAARDRGERRRLPGDPRPAGQLRRGRRRLVGVLPRPGRPRPVRGRAGHQRRAPRPGRRDRRDPARRRAGKDANALRGEPDVGDPEERVGLGEGAAALGLRPTRRRRGARPVRPRPGHADRQAPGRGRAPRRRPRRHPRVHRVPEGDLAADLVATTRRSGSTARSAAAPTSSASSPTGTR